MARTGKTTSASSAELRRTLLAWYRTHARDLPWRRTSDPYAIWVSEVMLQQTQVATVIPYFERWMRRFPTVTALARSRTDDVLHAWQGLGYYSRARGLLEGARMVERELGGRIPGDVATLRRLPGVGPYTAGAIASIAHGTRAAIVDGNVERVLCRLDGARGDPRKQPLKAELWRRAEALVPARGASTFNQALMELGAMVCTPKAPGCERCPWQGPCVARASSRQAELPEVAQRARPSALHTVAALVERRGHWLVKQVPAGALRWAGLWSFPHAEIAAREAPARALGRALGTPVTQVEHLRTLQHSITRFRITLDVYRCSPRARPDGRYVTPTQLQALAMPAAHRRIADDLTSVGRAPVPARAKTRSRP
ncbi:MAG: A/G-specific adenine glycosylase [Myxococcales bacterium]|nr:A/G-specific adenine glycosylase [Myxococcales bacterium]